MLSHRTSTTPARSCSPSAGRKQGVDARPSSPAHTTNTPERSIDKIEGCPIIPETREVSAGNLPPQTCGDQYQAVVTFSVSRALDW